MINKNKINDIALVAVMQYHGHSCELNDDGSFRICVSDNNFNNTLAIYSSQYRPVFQRIKRLRKGLLDRTKSAGVPYDENLVNLHSKGV